MTPTPLIELTRGGVLESAHFGAVAVVNSQGMLVASAGDPHRLTFSRSTLKAFQALPLLESGGHEIFGFNSSHLAMLCASHNGEAMHVLAIDEMLNKINLSHRALECGCHIPAQYSYFDTSPPPGTKWDQRHNNCSGKHVGFLAYCVQHGTPTANYVSPTHPLQTAIRQRVAGVVDMDEGALKMGIDGCSSPNYAMPLSKIAYAYARLAAGGNDSQFGSSFALLGDAMTTHPELVAGTGRNDLAFMQIGRGDWIAKVGADGVQAIASKSRRQALAIKITDGNRVALFATAVEVLAQLGWLDAVQAEQLMPWRAAIISNARDINVGERRPVFALQSFNES